MLIHSYFKYTVLMAGMMVISSVAISAAPNGANPSFYDKKAEGWYWYKDPKKLPPKKIIDQKPVVVVAPVQQNPTQQSVKVESPPAVFSVKWFNENMDAARIRALDNPRNPDGTPSKDMIAYMYFQRVALDKAQNFAYAAQDAVSSDPILDETSRIPIDTGAITTFKRMVEDDKKSALNSLTQKAGLWFFFDSTCQYCAYQYQSLNAFVSQYRFPVRYISMDNKPLAGMRSFLPNRGLAQQLNLKVTPAIVLVVPPNNFYIVSHGMSATSTIGDKILLAAASRNLLPQEIKDRIDPYNKGIMTPEQMKISQQEQAKLDKDPNAFVDLIKDALGGK